MHTPAYTSILENRRAALRTEFDRFLSGARDIVLEVGCGHGHFLTAYAQAHPDHTCIGIDLAGDRIERASRKRDRAKLANLHFVQAEARLFVDTLPPAAELAAIFILFPDPWPKLRHNKHRILQPSFLAQLAQHARLDCPLYFRTDWNPYYIAARQAIFEDHHWQLDESAPWPFECKTVFQERAAGYESLLARCKQPAARKVS